MCSEPCFETAFASPDRGGPRLEDVYPGLSSTRPSAVLVRLFLLQMETDRSFAKTRRLEQAALEQYCVPKDASQPQNASAAVTRACREILGAANTPDQFNATLNYNGPAEESWGGAVHGALQAARAYLWNQNNVIVDTLATGNNNEVHTPLVRICRTLNDYVIRTT